MRLLHYPASVRHGQYPCRGSGGIFLSFRDSRLDAGDRRDPVDGAVEGHDDAYLGRFGRRRQVGLGEVDPVVLVDIERLRQQSRIPRADRSVGEQRAHKSGRFVAVEPIVGLEDVYRLGDDRSGSSNSSASSIKAPARTAMSGGSPVIWRVRMLVSTYMVIAASQRALGGRCCVSRPRTGPVCPPAPRPRRPAP